MKKRFLIVAPAALVPNWKKQIWKFTKEVPFLIEGTVPDPYQAAEIIKGDRTYYLGSYTSLAKGTKVPEEWKEVDGKKIKIPEFTTYLWINFINMAKFDVIILDEAHFLKNVDSSRSKAFRELKEGKKLLLTGTPILNYPPEIWALLAMLDPKLAGSYDGFRNRYTLNGRTPKNVKELRESLKPILLRRTKKEVLKDLDPIERITEYVELSSQGREIYEEVVAGIWRELEILDFSAGIGKDSQKITNILAMFMRMKQVCAADKANYVADLAVRLHDSNDEKVLIFSQFVNKPPVVPEIAKKLGGEALSIVGTQSPGDRLDIVERFNTDKNIHFLVASLHATKLGLDITGAGSVIFNDLDWTPANHEQAEARAYGRMSDLHSITSYYIICQDTIEEVIQDILAKKLAIIDEVIEGVQRDRSPGIFMEVLKELKRTAWQRKGK